MHPPDAISQQVFLLERDSGVLCRILGLYAARGIDIARIDYAHAAPRTMVLTVTAAADVEMMRILVAKAASLFGVVEAAERSLREAQIA
jgi:acetolactate synthase small subunit